jgi:uncharacterized membrane protein YkvA (DUF1232 family)
MSNIGNKRAATHVTQRHEQEWVNRLIPASDEIALWRVCCMTQGIDRWKQKARSLKRETYALYLAIRDPRMPWYAKLLAVCVVGYAFSPIDLIPDFIPVLGYVDDLVLVPLGIALVLKMIPGELMVECREKAEAFMAQGKPTSWVAASIIIAVWLLLATFSVIFVIRILSS